MPGERKSVEPMAAIVAPARVSAKHQSLLHLVSQAAWSDDAVLAKVRELVLPTIEAQGKIEAWIVDDTGFAKKGVHSVGVARQYCGRLGKTDNCQIAVTLSIANHAASLPIAYELYLPEDWAADAARRKKAHVPDDATFRTKPEIALAQIRAALAAGVAPGVLLTDAGYGVDGAFRAGVMASGLTYVVGVQSTLSVWPPGVEPLPPKPWSGRGRPPSRMRRDGGHVPVSAKTLARELPGEAWRIVPWREGSNDILSSRFAAVRIRPASRDWKFSTPHPQEWLLMEWPEGEKEPTKTGFQPYPKTRPSTFSSTRPNCAGASSATTRNSKASSASPISKGEAGVDSTITPPSASPPTVFSSANERRFPPQAPGGAKCLAYPCVPNPKAPPIRPERHVENSIATIRRQLTIALARTLTRCPCCQALPSRRSYRGSS
jgi:SRSO17 transposase